MRKNFFLIVFALTYVSINSYAFKCKQGQNYVSRFDSSRLLSEEEIDGGHEYIDVISHMEGEIDGSQYILNKSMELYRLLGKTKTKVLKFDSQMSGDNTVVSVFKFKGLHFFEVGFNDFLEGYMSSIHVVDLKNKKVISTFRKCANNKEFFGLKNGVLTYMCEWYCEKNEYFTFDPKEKIFISVKKKHNCSTLSLKSKLNGLEQSRFKIRYKKDKNGVEYKSSRLLFNKKNCK